MVSEKRNITPRQTVELLHKKGINITEKEAEKILDLLYFLANLIVQQNFKS